jgi:hypothetical protein
MRNLNNRVFSLEQKIQASDQRKLFLLFGVSDDADKNEIASAKEKAREKYLEDGGDPHIRCVFNVFLRYAGPVCSWYFA